MPENRGFYQKYQVTRTDGKAIEGRTFVLELDRDRFALPAMRAYRDAMVAEGGFDLLVADLDRMIEEMLG